MPVIIHKNINEITTLLVWKITESLEYFMENVILNHNSKQRLQNMQFEGHQKGFLAVRMLLQEIGLSDNELFYTIDGKPNLSTSQNISISHSFDFSCILLSDSIIGIDIEKHKEKIKRIDYKFAASEMKYLKSDSQDYIELLTVVWGVKEVIFKIYNQPGISYNEHISILPFQLSDKKGIAELNFNSTIKNFTFEFFKIENYSLVYSIL